MEKSILGQIVELVKQPEFAFKPTQPTMGGIWGGDRYELEGFVYQLVDDGYTEILNTPNCKVVWGYNGQHYMKFEQGNEALLLKDLETLKARA